MLISVDEAFAVSKNKLDYDSECRKVITFMLLKALIFAALKEMMFTASLACRLFDSGF